MDINRMLEITIDLEQCAFCTDICTCCDKIKPITERELREYYREVRKALKGGCQIES